MATAAVVARGRGRGTYRRAGVVLSGGVRGIRRGLSLAFAACVGVSAASTALAARWTSVASSHGAGAARIPLGAIPPAVRRFCRDGARRHTFPVLCPTRWPHAPSSSVAGSGSSVLGPSFYWGSFNDEAGFDDGDDGHLVLGGQRPRLSLAGSPREPWPRPGQPQPIEQLGLPRSITTPRHGGGTYVVQRPARILRSSTVGAARALVLVAPGYPTGGLNSGHVLVVWNRHGHGYFVSLHYDGSRGTSYTQGARVSAALAIARSAQPSKG
jgi:hypothetical protein